MCSDQERSEQIVSTRYFTRYFTVSTRSRAYTLSQSNDRMCKELAVKLMCHNKPEALAILK